MHTHSNRDTEKLIDAGHHALSCYASHTALLEAIITHQADDLVTANTRIEELDGIEEEIKQDITILQHENALLHSENEVLRVEHAMLVGNMHGGEEMLRALAGRLQRLHGSVQDMNGMVQMLMEVAGLDEDDVQEQEQEHEDEAPGHYFEGGWEDMAVQWRAGPPIDRSSEPEPGNRPADVEPFDMAYWFERSNAPSPEERRPRNDDCDALRQIDTEMAILELQNRLERTEMQIRSLTDRIDAQETEWEMAVESIPVLLEAIYDEREDEEQQHCRYGEYEENEEEEGNDEPYCTCDDGWEELGSTDENIVLRGGMGGRDEDEEFVYDYGGYTNWDQTDRSTQGKVTIVDRKDDIIRDLRQKVERLEAKNPTLTEAAHRKDLSQSADHVQTKDDDSTGTKSRKPNPLNAISASIFYEKEKEDKHTNLRGGDGEAESGVDGNRDHTNTEIRTPIPVSPHLLCQRATSRASNLTVHYIIVYLPPGFSIPDSTKHELVFHSAATIYYFPKGATEEIVQQEAWKQKSCGDRKWQNVELHKIQSKQTFKNAIAEMWKSMGLSWDVLTRGDWDFNENDDEGDLYMVNDNSLFLTDRTSEVAVSYLRGGADSEPIQSSWPIDEDDDLSDEFKRIHKGLMDEARITLTMDSPEQRVHAWTIVATAAQTRNSFLEREIEVFREMNDSLTQDLQWHMDIQVELEERLEAAEADKRAMAEEHQDLRTILHHLVVNDVIHAVCTCKEKELPAYGDCMGSPDLRTMRGGDKEESLQSTSPTKQKSSAPTVSSFSTPHSSTDITANSFVFYPQRSTIVFPGTPPHIYLFPYSSTLLEIHEMVKNGSEKEDFQNDPYVARILEIMKIRKDMGIHLPDIVSDERIIIDIPEVPMGFCLDRKTKITAWLVADADTKDLEKLVEKLEIGSRANKSQSDTRTKDTSSEGENDYYGDVGDLINELDDPVDTDNSYDWPRLCVCQDSSVYGSGTHYRTHHAQSSSVSETPPVVLVRGGGSNLEYWSHDACGNREFPLRYPQQTPLANAPTNKPMSYGTIAPPSRHVPGFEVLATSKAPLSMRLGRFMFPPMFVQQRENSIRRFDWQHIRRLSPQFKDKSSRGFRYTRSAQCEDWTTQLDKHRAHCDHCQGIFIEEDYGSSDGSPRHEDEASKPTSGPGRPWKKSGWPENSTASSLTAVEDPDPRLRGGAGSEADLEYDSDDWRSEWNDLASQTQSSGRLPRTFRNSSTLSTKTTTSPPSPVDRRFTLRHRPQQSSSCTTTEFIRAAPTISEHGTLQKNGSVVRAETKKSRGESILERPPTRYDSLQYGASLGVSVVESDCVSDLRAENWLENPRPAPPPPNQCHSTSWSQSSQQLQDIGLRKVYESNWSKRYDARPRETSFPSDLHEFFPADSTFSENTLRSRNRRIPSSVLFSEPPSNKMYEERLRSRPAEEPRPSSPKPRLGVKLCKRCEELLALLMEYINKLRQRMLVKRPGNGVPRSATETPAAPAPSRMDWEARHMNRGLPALPFDKSLPPTPRASISAVNLPREPKEKYPAALHVEPKEKLRAASWASISVIDHAHAIAQAQYHAHADFINQEGGEWDVPTIAGPSDLVKEALMWLRCEMELEKMGKTVFDESKRDDSSYEYARSENWVIL
ncbi:hypothetical protein G6011_09367 [Alternaria panax]|uniref:Uncharacterized protein n=1 Tax=Alternaria panax TaxID=48097 RepID=A0AAD4IB55_9PLEO|nr:hypothetical protein G6011_09367 [Alternaria panax]